MLIASLAIGVPFFIGTYTEPGGSEGIYRATLDPTTGALSAPVLAAKADNPSYLALHPGRKYLYSVHEGQQGAVSGYAIEGDALRLINRQTFPGQWTCHLSVDPSGRTLLAATYGVGVAVSLPIAADGSLGAPGTVFTNSGSGPNRSRQEGPHMHFITADPSGRFAYACDLGTDEVLTFGLDAAQARLELLSRDARVAPGSGPRHLAISRNGRWVYVNSELTMQVTAFTRDPQTGRLERGQSDSTLPDDVSQEVRARSSTAGIALHPNGRFLYVSNRGHDSIAVFEVRGGSLRRVQVASAGVKTPRGFAIAPDGRWLIVAGQDGNVLRTLRLDPTSGKLEPTAHRITVSKPVCIVF